MIRRPQQLYPQPMIDELLRLYRSKRDWIAYRERSDCQYQITPTHEARSSWLMRQAVAGQDYFSMWSVSIWYGDGPKVVRLTERQCEALEQVEVRLHLDDYAQPFPAVLVDFPDGRYNPFQGVLCHHAPSIGVLVASLVAPPSHQDDIVTTLTGRGMTTMEVAINQFDDDCKALAEPAGKCLRVALNVNLALTGFDTRSEYLFPKEVISDRRLAAEKTERGERARKRLAVAPVLVSFAREVELHAKSGARDGEGEITGREVSSHWRRGHWRMQPYGPLNRERKRILIKPVLVRADKFAGPASATTTVYKPATI